MTRSEWKKIRGSSPAPDQILLTINAIDGTVIDRNLGY